MDAVTMARDLLHEAHETIEQAIDGLSEAQLHARLPGSTVGSIAEIYVHTLVGEDMTVHELINRGQTVWEREGWFERLALPAELPHVESWGHEVRIRDLAAVRDYAKRVYATTDEVLAALSPVQLDEGRETPAGERTVGYLVGVWVGWHACHHGGEICALKGAMGERGLQF